MTTNGSFTSQAEAAFAQLDEPADQARFAQEVLNELRNLTEAWSQRYTDSIRFMHQEEGQSYAEIAAELDISRARVGQIMLKPVA
jgi:DNA-directed RNA polymerase specialized sigma24 family protein